MTSSFLIQYAARICRDGGVIAYPTEAVFGLGCDPLNQAAVNKILQLKVRPLRKGMILIAAHVEQLLPFINCTPQELQRLDTIPEQPTTWLVRKATTTPQWITGQHDKIAVRITQHPIAHALCRQLDSPLISTSANPAGSKPAKNLLKTRQYFHNAVDFYVPGYTGTLKNPTQIRDLETDTVIRAS
ncbi:MAG: tRNA threonylcarbamoyladenosine biosynthesis protein RimN [Gammaproteobacteria bacterium]|nr:MAG: tRNA threonylcarbamoyladenosine biosynthesis protein RimN [Gammaproteobacteria bacterium]